MNSPQRPTLKHCSLLITITAFIFQNTALPAFILNKQTLAPGSCLRESSGTSSRSYTGTGGSNRETHPAIFLAFEKYPEKDLDIKDKEITMQALTLLEKERFQDEFGGWFRKLRILAIPDLPLDGHYGTGGLSWKHDQPTIYIPKKLFNYLSLRFREKDATAAVELADYIYHKFMEMCLVKKLNKSAEEAHQTVEHTDYYRYEKEYLYPETFDFLNPARENLLRWINHHQTEDFKLSAYQKIFLAEDVSDEAFLAALREDKETLRDHYLKIKNNLNGLALRYIQWILTEYPPSTGKRRLVICRQEAHPFGVMLTEAVAKLGWSHLQIKEIYLNEQITGKRHCAMGLKAPPAVDTKGNNTDEEIMEYLRQKGLLDGTPLTFMDTGPYGEIPWICEDIIDRLADKKPASMETLLFIHKDKDGVYEYSQRYQEPENIEIIDGKHTCARLKTEPLIEIDAVLADIAATNIIAESIANGTLLACPETDAKRNEIKNIISGLLRERQQSDKRHDTVFRTAFETAITAQIENLHDTIDSADVTAFARVFDNLSKMDLDRLDLSEIYILLRRISALDLLGEIKECAIGPTQRHIALVPGTIKSLAQSDWDYFKDRFTAVTEQTDLHLSNMRKIMAELSLDKEILNGFVIALLLHDYGLLLMRSGVNTHAPDGEKLLKTFLDKFDLPDKTKQIILILIGEHAKLFMLLKGLLPPVYYRESIARFQEIGIDAEKALKMTALFQFLDSISADIDFLKEKRWHSDNVITALLQFSYPDPLNVLAQHYPSSRLPLLIGNIYARISDETATVFDEIDEDTGIDVLYYINHLWFNVTQSGGNLLRDLCLKNGGTKTIDNPNIYKLFYILAYLYKNHNIDPEDYPVFLLTNDNTADFLNRLLDKLSVASLKEMLSGKEYPFKIEIENNLVVINLKQHETETSPSPASSL